MHRMTIVLAAGLVACTTVPDVQPASTTMTAPTASSPAQPPRLCVPLTVSEVTDIVLAFERHLNREKSSYQLAGVPLSAELEARLKQDIITTIVVDRLIAQKAKAEGVTVTPEELAIRLTAYKASFGDDKAYADALDATYQSADDVEADVYNRLLHDKLLAKLFVSTEPTEADAKKHYNEHRESYTQRESIKASHIFFKVEPDTSTRDKETILAQALTVLAEARKPGADFGALAEKHSDDTTLRRGDLGHVARGVSVEPFEKAAFAANVGDVIGPVETVFGYHVIKVHEKTAERQRSFDEVKSSILHLLMQQQKARATRELLDSLKSCAEDEAATRASPATAPTLQPPR